MMKTNDAHYAMMSLTWSMKTSGFDSNVFLSVYFFCLKSLRLIGLLYYLYFLPGLNISHVAIPKALDVFFCHGWERQSL